jgi:hypothetical protein
MVALFATSVPPRQAVAASSHAGRGKCCRVAAGTPVQVELVDTLSSATQKPGDTFALRLSAPLIVDGMVVLPKGAPGQGEVIESKGPGIGGKPGKMVLAAKYVSGGRGRVALNALQLSAPGQDRSRTSQAVGLSGMAFAPLKFVGVVVPGGQVEFRPGTVAGAKVATAVTLPPLRRASRQEIALASSTVGHAAPEVAGPIAIGPPPPGHGQVVFFRPKSLLGVGQWFNVRENGKALGKLSNGAYFVEVTRPGVHTYSAKLEPELNDHLTLKVDAGETYFVEGALTGGLVLGAADLSPSTRDKFEGSAKDLKLAEAPAGDEHAPAAGDSGRPAAETRAPSAH